MTEPQDTCIQTRYIRTIAVPITVFPVWLRYVPMEPLPVIESTAIVKAIEAKEKA